MVANAAARAVAGTSDPAAFVEACVEAWHDSLAFDMCGPGCPEMQTVWVGGAAVDICAPAWGITSWSGPPDWHEIIGCIRHANPGWGREWAREGIVWESIPTYAAAAALTVFILLMTHALVLSFIVLPKWA